MHLLTFLFVLPLARVVVFGQITSPSAGATYEAGSTLNIEWKGGDAPATIVLETGVPEIPASGTTIASNIPNTGSYSWTIPSSITPADNYAIVIFGSGFALTGSNFEISDSGSSASSTSSLSSSTSATSTLSAASFGGTTTSKTLSSTSASSQASTSSAITNASKGISNGTKAGIGAGVTLGVLVLIFLVLGVIWYRRRQYQTQTKTRQTVGTDAKPNTHEMGTDVTRYELLTNKDVHEIEQEKQVISREMSRRPHELDDGLPAEAHELDPNSHILGPELDSNEYPSLYELETTSRPAASAQSPHITTPGPGSIVSRKPVAASASKEVDDEDMRILQDRMEKIREEKERLQKIQELELLEEETKRAILEKARRKDRS